MTKQCEHRRKYKSGKRTTINRGIKRNRADFPRKVDVTYKAVLTAATAVGIYTALANLAQQRKRVKQAEERLARERIREARLDAIEERRVREALAKGYYD
jgi:hypothetical protein